MNTGIWWATTTEHGEVFLYRNGALIYKRWSSGASVTFGAVPAFPYWNQRDHDIVDRPPRGQLRSVPMTDHSQMRLGKQPARHDARTLLLASYLTPHLPPAPSHVDWAAKVAGPWPLWKNDELGDCTACGAAHMIQTWTANGSTEYAMPEAEVVNFYEDACGYDPADPNTDQGGVLLDVLKYWRKAGCGGHKIGAFVAVPTTSKTLTMDGLWLFGGLYLGIALPLSAQSQRVWDVPHGGAHGKGAPNTWGGHCVNVVAADARGLTCVTWGATKRLTWGFLRAYCDESYAIVSPDWVSGERAAPSGFDLATLQADLAAL